MKYEGQNIAHKQIQAILCTAGKHFAPPRAELNLARSCKIIKRGGFSRQLKTVGCGVGVIKPFRLIETKAAVRANKWVCGRELSRSTQAAALKPHISLHRAADRKTKFETI